MINTSPSTLLITQLANVGQLTSSEGRCSQVQRKMPGVVTSNEGKAMNYIASGRFKSNLGKRIRERMVGIIKGRNYMVSIQEKSHLQKYVLGEHFIVAIAFLGIAET